MTELVQSTPGDILSIPIEKISVTDNHHQQSSTISAQKQDTIRTLSKQIWRLLGKEWLDSSIQVRAILALGLVIRLASKLGISPEPKDVNLYQARLAEVTLRTRLLATQQPKGSISENLCLQVASQLAVRPVHTWI